MQADTIGHLADALRRGGFTSEALVRGLLARAEAAEPMLQAFSGLYAEHALAQARALDAERRLDRVRGPLHGIPIVLKDVFDVAGQPTTGSSRLYADNFASSDALVVRRLLESGAIVLGKTRQQELGFGGWGTNAVAGTPRNPWDLATQRAPGGSSSGAAVAVAAGLAVAAVGTDTGGSLRIPASLCGLVALKPTAGQVPRDGVMLLSQTFDSIGPLTRTAADARLIYASLAGVPEISKAPLPGRLRVGILTARDIATTHNDVLQGYDDFVEYLLAMRASLTEFSPGKAMEEFVERIGVIIAFEGWQNHGLRILQTPAGMDPHVRRRFLQGQKISPAAYEAALRDREDSMREMAELMDSYDVLMTPTTPISAPPLSEVDEYALPLPRFTRLVNYLGLCALAMPARLGQGGMPVSVQLIGKPGSEALLLSLAEVLEDHRGPFPLPDLGTLGPG